MAGWDSIETGEWARSKSAFRTKMTVTGAAVDRNMIKYMPPHVMFG
jgi:hypothetical protein